MKYFNVTKIETMSTHRMHPISHTKKCHQIFNNRTTLQKAQINQL